MIKQLSKKRVELSRHLLLPVLFLAMLSLPWFLGGREPFGLLIGLLLTSLLFISWLLVSRHQALAISHRPRAILWPLAGLLVWTLLSCFWSVSQYASLKLVMTLVSASTIFIVARDIFRDSAARDFFVRILVMIVAVTSVIGLWIFMTGDYERVTSLFYWANPFATFCLAGLGFGLFLVHESTGRAQKAWLGATALITSGLFLSYSRAAWMIAIVVVALLVLQAGDWRNRVRQLFIIVMAAALISIVALGIRSKLSDKPTLNVKDRVAESAQSSSVTDRFAFWQEGAAMFAARPLTGWGVGSYENVHPAFQVSPVTAGNNPHSTLIQAFVELGVIGASLFMLAAAGFLRLLWLDRGNRQDRLLWSARWVVLAIGLHSLVDLVSNYPVLLFVWAIALALALPPLLKTDEFRLRLRRVWVSVILVAGSLLALTGAAFRLYDTSTTKLLINLSAPYDFNETNRLYGTILKGRLINPADLSDAAIFLVDASDKAETNQAGLLNTALGFAERAVRLEPYNAQHYYALANVQQRLGRTNEALKAYRRAIELDPYDNPQYQISYASLLQHEGFSKEALTVLQAIAREYTDPVLANRNFILSIPQRVSIVQSMIAQLYFDAGNTNAARRAADRAVRINPTNEVALGIQKAIEDASR